MARRLPARIVDLVNRPWDKASTHLQDIINAILDWLNDSWGGLQITTKTIREFAAANPDSTFDTGIENHVAKFSNPGTIGVAMPITTFDAVSADGTENFLRVVGTLPTQPASFSSGVVFDITSAGSAAIPQVAATIELLPGFTGNTYTEGLFVSNETGGPTTNYISQGNDGIYSASGNLATVGSNVGVFGEAFLGNINIGTLGSARAAKNSAANVGIFGIARNTGTTPVEIGGYFCLTGGTPVLTGMSAALVADNVATTQYIARFQNNSIDQVLVGDGVPADNSQHFLEVVGTLPSSPSLNPQGVLVNVTGAGSTSVGIEAATIFLKAGYTGSGYSEALNTSNFTAGTNTDLLLGGNVGAFGSSSATTTGTNVGFQADARGGNISAGVVGAATTAKNSATNIGVLGLGRNTGTTPIEVGGYFGLNTSNPTFTSAALIADNAAVAVPIFRARDNGTDVVRIADGGAVELSTISSIATNGSIQIGGTDVVTPGTSTWAGAERAAGQTDGSGGVLILHSGRGTGTGAGGDLHLQVAPASASSGTTQNALQNFLTASAANGNVNIGGVALSNAAPLTSNWAGAERAAGVADGGGGPVVIRSGRGTGTGPTGTVIIQLSPAAASTGTTQNTLRDVEKWDVSSVADPQSTDITLTGNNGGTMVRKSFSELLTLNTGSTTTDTTANLLPANAIILSVTTRVTTTITTATTFSVGDPTTAARFSATAGGLTAGSTRVGLQHQQGSVATDAAGPVQTTAAKVRITTDANPGAGVIRIQVWALVFAAPTS